MLGKEVTEIALYWGIDVRKSNVLSDKAFLLTDKKGGKFVLKKKGSLEEAKKEIELLRFLHQEQIKVHLPLSNLQGDDVLAYGGESYCMYYYLEGRVFEAKEVILNAKVPQLLGEALAFLHRTLVKVDPSIHFPTRDLYTQVSNWALEAVVSVDESLKEIYQMLEAELNERIERLPKQLIHRDPHVSNLIFNNDLLWFIDFDLVENNVRLFDVCYCATSVLSETFSDEELKARWFDFVKRLVGAYTKINPLNNLELTSIWHVMLAIQMIFMAYFVDYPHLFETNKKMFLWIYENKTPLERALLLENSLT